MSSKPGGVFPAFGGDPGKQKAAGFQRLPPMLPMARRNRLSEPLRAAAVRPAVTIIAVAIVAAIPATIVAIPVHAHPAAMPPTLSPAEAVLHMGQHRKPALLAVVQRLVERIGRIRDLLHGGRRDRHVVGA